ncbi:ornithine cyclodeaminase family protein [Pelomonas sp. SE-A7]|uniref:ornithine cyclodeaminase family protein n=1 Tax=Pelomonas sp. SE-A7 TaxID=3054953 RepID=UPI00259CFF24|nr:ornithine cyclodeaminase family protein [Pelomonas sp. SE-A7]MDM4764969.1 ornithine cyclodeaminase family protein [Pelomonas sp. SE-A7]
MRHFDAEATRAALPFAALIEALRQQFIEGCEVPLRHQHAVGQDLTLLIMPAWQADGLLGIKTVSIAPGNAGRDLPGLYSSYSLFDAATGQPLALMDGNEITSRRTAAASALAASRLASPQARTLLVVGSGRVASLLPEAYSTALPGIERILVWSRRAEAAESLASQLRRLGLPISAAADLEAAVRQADIVSCATLSREPLIRGAWLAEGSHLDLMGGFTPEMREADSAAVSGADLWVDTDEALRKSGDLLLPQAEGCLLLDARRGDLADLCRLGPGEAHRPGRRTLFKSVGTALEDLAAARLVYGGRAG